MEEYWLGRIEDAERALEYAQKQLARIAINQPELPYGDENVPER